MTEIEAEWARRRAARGPKTVKLSPEMQAWTAHQRATLAEGRAPEPRHDNIAQAMKHPRQPEVPRPPAPGPAPRYPNVERTTALPPDLNQRIKERLK